ncbi:MAG: M15 family metallopeptidase [Synechococcales bacterium]|nr:M15 family metallopeptidase [Synechococcales bacterium]
MTACQRRTNLQPVRSPGAAGNLQPVPIASSPIATPAPSVTPSVMPSASPSPLPKDRSQNQLALDKLAPDQLVDVQAIAPDIRLDFRYATSNNFLKRAVYPARARCLLRLTIAQRLAQVQQDLRGQGLGLKVFDCYRPLSVQKQMWAILPDSNYIANPARGSRHNRGAAVDLTLVTVQGKALEMPTDFDDFSDRAAQDYAGGTAASRRNRQILRQAMEKRGFTTIVTEWWHFDGPGWQQFPILDHPL